jgi:hypothetical protein
MPSKKMPQIAKVLAEPDSKPAFGPCNRCHPSLLATSDSVANRRRCWLSRFDRATTLMYIQKVDSTQVPPFRRHV